MSAQSSSENISHSFSWPWSCPTHVSVTRAGGQSALTLHTPHCTSQTSPGQATVSPHCQLITTIITSHHHSTRASALWSLRCVQGGAPSVTESHIVRPLYTTDCTSLYTTVHTPAIQSVVYHHWAPLSAPPPGK